MMRCLNRSRRAPAGLVQAEGSQQSLRPVGVDRALQEAGASPTPYARVSGRVDMCSCCSATSRCT